jgi:hypothetical protein
MNSNTRVSEVQPGEDVPSIAHRFGTLADDGQRALWQLRGLIRLINTGDIENLDGDCFDIIEHCAERIEAAWTALLPSLPGTCAEIEALAVCQHERQKRHEKWKATSAARREAIVASMPDVDRAVEKAGQRVLRAQAKKPGKVRR